MLTGSRRGLPRVSVVLPVRNGERFIRASVSTILAQTVQELELIVVDDGSTDGTARVLASIPDVRLRVLPLQAVGLSRALNAGVESARAPLVARADGDDLNHRRRLEMQLAYFECKPKVNVLGSAFRAFDSRTGATAYIAKVMLSDWDLRRDLYVRCPFGHPTVVFRRSAFETAGGYDPSQRLEDWDLWHRMPGQFANLPHKLVDYRIHAAQMTAGLRQQDVADMKEHIWQSGRPPSPAPWRLAAGLKNHWQERRWYAEQSLAVERERRRRRRSK